MSCVFVSYLQPLGLRTSSHKSWTNNFGVAVELDHCFAAELNQHYLAQRVGKSARQLSNKGQLLPDQTLFPETDSQGCAGATWPALCVEIKPKWGALPTSLAVSPDSVKRKVSKYQLHQRLKLSQGKISSISGYDPLDLFSSDPNRVQRALLALFQEPQNNLRLFLGGKALQLQPGRDLQVAAAAVAAAFGPQFATVSPLEAVQTLTGTIQSILAKEDLLAALLQIQQLDRHDIEVIHPLYEHLNQHVAGSADGVDTKCKAGLQDRPNTVGQHTASAHSQIQHLLEQTHAEQLLTLREYLLAATAKDCSIMITMQQLPCNHCHADVGLVTIPGCQLTAKYRIAVVDLDMKSCGKIPGHFMLDCQLTDCH